MRHYENYVRWLYRGGRPSWFARLQNRGTAGLFGAGLMANRAGALEIQGRKTGRAITFPVVIAGYEGQRYLVSMLGRDVNWVRNLEAAGGQAVLRHGPRETVHLAEVDPVACAPILRRYLQVAPGARPHIPVSRDAPLAEFERIAGDYPVFRIEAAAVPARRVPADGPAGPTSVAPCTTWTSVGRRAAR